VFEVVMALRFISHKEVSFRQLLGMLRSPPVAVMSYYTNLFLSARFVFGEQPEKIRHLDKEIRRVECMVGVNRTAESYEIQKDLNHLANLRRDLDAEKQQMERLYDMAGDEGKKELEQIFRGLAQQMDEIDRQEYNLLFKLQPLMNLKIIETYMDNNMDLKSFFKEGGKVVTQMELSSELDKVKIWVYQEAVEMMPYVRFTKLE
jgi:hypothetical protein